MSKIVPSCTLRLVGFGGAKALTNGGKGEVPELDFNTQIPE